MKLERSSFSFVELWGAMVKYRSGTWNDVINVLSTIVSATHRQQEHVYTQAVRKSEGNGDRTTFARQVR